MLGLEKPDAAPIAEKPVSPNDHPEQHPAEESLNSIEGGQGTKAKGAPAEAANKAHNVVGDEELRTEDRNGFEGNDLPPNLPPDLPSGEAPETAAVESALDESKQGRCMAD